VIFNWSGIKDNQLVSGQLDLPSKAELLQQLTSDGIVVTKVAVEDFSAADRKASPSTKKRRKKKVKVEELLLFTKKFASMIAAGLAIVPALNMLKIQSESPAMMGVIEHILLKVNEGVPLSAALREHPELFDTVYVSLVEAGESSGGLDVFLKKISDNIQKRVKITRALKSAMSYPLMLLGVAVIVIGIMMVYVVPVFADIFSSSGQELPGPTKMVMTISNFFRSYYMVGFLALIFGSVKLFKIKLNTDQDFKVTIDKRMLSMPLIGKMIRNSVMARFSEVLSNLIAGGVNLIEAIEISKSSISNFYIRRCLGQIQNQINAGEPIAKSLRATGAFPETFCGFVEVGEETGRLNDMLTTVSVFYEDEFDDSVATFSQMLEPIMIVFLGVVIGFILVAMYMPIFNMGNNFA
jgi:type IV pilus assembly protein PilC